MPRWTTLSTRHLQPELMDQPELDEARHLEALEALARINFVSRSAQILWPSIRRLAGDLGSKRLRVLDIATGGGDVPINLWRTARRAGIDLQIVGADISDVAVAQSRRRAAAASAEVEFTQMDILSDPPADTYDVVTSSLFLHHLDNEQAVQLLATTKRLAKHLVLVNDLTRSRLGLFLAHLATTVLSRSDVARVDGPRSVEGAFSRSEALVLAKEAGLHGATVSRRWPCRYLLEWRRPSR
jgi:2-polyprenyl-3-methyl-5-hydroxy-6-metoxy-1,4-benzoquinol methylase